MLDTITDRIADDYRRNYEKYGYSPKSLGWNKGKQFLRFHSLTHTFDLEKSSILDFGCGFGDFNAYLQKIGVLDYEYTGVDVTREFIAEGRKRYGAPNVVFLEGDFLEMKLPREYDYVISSGVFNHGLIADFEGGGYAFIEKCMRRAFEVCGKVMAFDFLSDRVEYTLDHTFHSSPERILRIAYNLSRSVILDNSYFPFEFTLLVYKDDSFPKETTTFFNTERELAWLL